MHQTAFQRFIMSAASLASAGIIATAAHAQCDTWQSVGAGLDNIVVALASHQNNLFVGGIFNSGGGQTLNSIARWDGSAWHPMHTGMNESVLALAIHNGQPVAGGTFTMASGQPANRIARWNGVFWQPMSSGTNGTIFALTVRNGQLIAGGAFQTAGGVTANNIARWDGAFWQPLGSGLNGPVTAMTVFEGDLIVGGFFTQAGGVPAANIARWDGTNWHPLGNGLSNHARSLAVYNGELIAGGNFNSSGDQPLNRIARWDGTNWQPLGSGIGIGGNIVSDLAVYAGELYAGGGFTSAGGQSAINIARWNGETWQSVANNNLNFDVLTIEPFAGDLFIGGHFFVSQPFALHRIARLRNSPAVAAAPQNVIVNEGERAMFTTEVFSDETGPFTYQWHRGGLPLANSETISGVTTPTLTINDVTMADIGAYDIVITNSCGSTTSYPAALAVLPAEAAPACPGDLNLDSVVDVTDLLMLLANWGVCP